MYIMNSIEMLKLKAQILNTNDSTERLSEACERVGEPQQDVYNALYPLYCKGYVSLITREDGIIIEYKSTAIPDIARDFLYHLKIAVEEFGR